MRAISDTFWSALKILSAHKLRSLLTLLGIVIGVLAVVSMAAVTVGLRLKVNKDLEQLGTGVFQVQKWPAFGGGGHNNWAKYEKRKNLTLSEVNLLQMSCVSCLRAGGEVWEGGKKITAGDKTMQGVQTAGGTVEFFDNNGYALGSGRFFTEGEAMHAADVAVLGADIVDVLFPDGQALGKTIRIQSKGFRVIGVIERRGQTLGFSLDNLVAIPISSWFLMFGTKQSVNITVQARDPEHPGIAQDEVVALLRKERGVAPEAENDFEMFSNASVQQTFDEMTSSIAAASIGICGISLLIGGIGVMNIMLVSVTERTSEIGLRRALGARRRRILGQFVTESMMLCSVGGLIGVFCGIGVSMLIHALFDLPTLVPAWAVAMSLIMAGGTGLVFGIYPAWRASRLDPVEAMRQE